MATGLTRVRVEELHRYCVEAMLASGLSAEDAGVTADVLVTTDTWGVFTHGTKQLRMYLVRVRAGGTDPKAVPQVAAEGPGWAIIDARGAMAMVSSVRAMNLAVQKARACGIAYVGVRRSTHFGAAGYYANLAAEQGMMGLSMSNVDTNMNAPGARGGVIGNNPFAYAVPVEGGHPILLDVALSAVAAGKIAAARERGEPIPDTWMVDQNGKPSTNPADYPDVATLLPMGGYKGYGFAVMVEVLAATLTGAAMTKDIKSWVQQPDQVTDEGHAFVAIDVGAMMPKTLFAQRVRKMASSIRDAPKVKGAERIYLPGEKEWEKREAALKDGIELPSDVVAALQKMGEETGVRPPASIG